MKQKLIFSNEVGKMLDKQLEAIIFDRLFILVDENTASYALPLLIDSSKYVSNAKVLTIKPDDANKNLDTLELIWQQLSDNNATRSSIIINLGGGMVSDIGGFAASTYMRGMRFINIPTTLLAAVDASVGGKTGINFNGYKNQIGVINEAESSIISSVFFKTLPKQELFSGYAEMIKHGLLDGLESTNQVLSFRIAEPDFDISAILSLTKHSISVKQRFVEADINEAGIRKALNLGHTAGHAIESLMQKRNTPLPHGYAVAHGLVIALVLSHLQLQLPSDILYRLANYVYEMYGTIDISCDDYPALISAMQHDKKNFGNDTINFTLLKEIGKVQINSSVTAENIGIALDIYRDLMHIA
ncbi:MAG: 3-dehydroquinate synthase [Muribaculaceae bacterium]|nr:3-dehydroquinate synthase [Muribaculaceae bacterium]